MQTFVANLNREILNPLIFLLFAVAALYLVYGIFVFVANADNEKARAEGKQHIMYSIIGLFIMLGAVAIINLVLNTFGVPTL
jgi:hypothetical protein